MKESPKPGMNIGGFKVASDAWHSCEFQEGIDWMHGKGGEGIWQDEQGNKAVNLPVKVVDDNDEDNGALIGITVFTKGGGDAMATILDAAGLWKAVTDKFPGDISVFDPKVIDGIKIKLPGRPVMVLSEVDKKGFAKGIKVASFEEYKQIKAAGGDGPKSDKKGGKKEEKKSESQKADDWG